MKLGRRGGGGENSEFGIRNSEFGIVESLLRKLSFDCISLRDGLWGRLISLSGTYAILLCIDDAILLGTNLVL